VIKDLVNSKSVNKDSIQIQGGELFLHPYYEEVLNEFGKIRIGLVSNGILTDKLVRLVEKYKIAGVTISLDGTRASYQRIRGVDAYENVLETLDLLKNKTNLSVNFTAAPWNTYEDYLHVRKISTDKNIRFMFNIYSKMEYTGRPNEEVTIDERFEKNESNPYATFYNTWVNGDVNIPCLTMRFLAIITPNGNVVLCCAKDVVLGNLYENSFDEIWNSEKTKSIQRKNRFCNDCWVASHRPFDIKFSLLMKRIFPPGLGKKVIEAI
jgi:MoaA/NifB/PqqE/SkfB family radical SAM enzyme